MFFIDVYRYKIYDFILVLWPSAAQRGPVRKSAAQASQSCFRVRYDVLEHSGRPYGASVSLWNSQRDAYSLIKYHVLKSCQKTCQTYDKNEYFFEFSVLRDLAEFAVAFTSSQFICAPDTPGGFCQSVFTVLQFVPVVCHSNTVEL